MTVLIIGAGGQIGSAAEVALGSHHEIVGVGRNTNPAVDTTDSDSIRALFETVGQVDAVVVATAAGTLPFRPVTELTADDYREAFEGKVLSQLDVVRIGVAFVKDGGSFTLTSGITAREPVPHGAAAALANGALESFVISAATELPRGIRINIVSPTVLEGSEEFYDAFPGFNHISPAAVGRAFLKSVDGVQTGQIYALDGI
ncbi:short chain dehydrogenase [Paenarthrobacter sp. NPDC090520]|uniref:short chain dehydrogenase n=1 Tax=Paenarthrobacter sp. NPDC090520 TaxID=3364382 RepID=UPI0038171C48